MENNQTELTAEEVLDRHIGGGKDAHKTEEYSWILPAMQEYADLQTASLQAENENLWKKSGELVNHFFGRTKIELEQPNKIYLQADVAKDAEVTWSEDRASETDVCYIRIDAYERLQAEKAELVEALIRVDEVLDDDDKDRKKVKKMLTVLLKRY